MTDMWKVFILDESDNSKTRLPASLDTAGSPIIPSKDAHLIYEAIIYHVKDFVWDYNDLTVTIIAEMCI